jgi:predicted acylesterase/phospholipase RssA
VGPGLPPIGEVLGRATVLGSWRAARANRARAALVVTVPDDDTGLLDFDRIDVMVAAGRGAAQAALPELRAAVRSESRDDDGTVTG